MLRIVKKVFAFLVLISIAGILIVVIQLFQFQSEAVSLSEPEQTFVITPGSNIKLIAQELSLKKIIDDPWLFIFFRLSSCAIQTGFWSRALSATCFFAYRIRCTHHRLN